MCAGLLPEPPTPTPAPLESCSPQTFVQQLPDSIRTGAQATQWACMHNHAIVTFSLTCEKCLEQTSYIFRKVDDAWQIIGAGDIQDFTCEGPEQPLPFEPCNELFDAYHQKASKWPGYDRWSDCAGFCNVASQHCKLTEAGEGMMCQMRCDVAAQFEGQPMPDAKTKALRKQLVCTQAATTCTQVRECLVR